MSPVKMGQPSRLKNEAKSGRSDFFDIQLGENRVRILYGPIKSSTIYWPTQVIEEGEKKTRKKSIVRPPEGCVLDSIATAEKKLRISMGEEGSTSLKPSTKYYYLVLDEGKPEPKVEIARFPYSVYKRIEELEEQLDNEVPTNLAYGLCFMFTWVIKKTVDNALGKMKGTKYTVDPDVKSVSKFAGKIPAASLGMEWDELVELFTMKKIEKLFTPEQFSAWQDCEIDIEEEMKPHTADAIMDKLIEFPIDLNAKDNDKYIFAMPEKLAEVLLEMEIPLLAGGKKELPAKEEAPPAKNEESPAKEEKAEVKTDNPPADAKETDAKVEDDDSDGLW